MPFQDSVVGFRCGTCADGRSDGWLLMAPCVAKTVGAAAAPKRFAKAA
jgi:hypothetical protein